MKKKIYQYIIIFVALSFNYLNHAMDIIEKNFAVRDNLLYWSQYSLPYFNTIEELIKHQSSYIENFVTIWDHYFQSIDTEDNTCNLYGIHYQIAFSILNFSTLNEFYNNIKSILINQIQNYQISAEDQNILNNQLELINEKFISYQKKNHAVKKKLLLLFEKKFNDVLRIENIENNLELPILCSINKEHIIERIDEYLINFSDMIKKLSEKKIEEEINTEINNYKEKIKETIQELEEFTEYLKSKIENITFIIEKIEKFDIEETFYNNIQFMKIVNNILLKKISKEEAQESILFLNLLLIYYQQKIRKLENTLTNPNEKNIKQINMPEEIISKKTEETAKIIKSDESNEIKNTAFKTTFIRNIYAANESSIKGLNMSTLNNTLVVPSIRNILNNNEKDLEENKEDAALDTPQKIKKSLLKIMDNKKNRIIRKKTRKKKIKTKKIFFNSLIMLTGKSKK